jgi:hypothetical protein
VTVVTGIRRLEKEDASVQGAMVNSPAWNSLFNKFHAKIFSAYIINADTIITKKKIFTIEHDYPMNKFLHRAYRWRRRRRR